MKFEIAHVLDFIKVQKVWVAFVTVLLSFKDKKYCLTYGLFDDFFFHGVTEQVLSKSTPKGSTLFYRKNTIYVIYALCVRL